MLESALGMLRRPRHYCQADGHGGGLHRDMVSLATLFVFTQIKCSCQRLTLGVLRGTLLEEGSCRLGLCVWDGGCPSAEVGSGGQSLLAGEAASQLLPRQSLPAGAGGEGFFKVIVLRAGVNLQVFWWPLLQGDG